MKEQKFNDLAQFLGAYFHQDWSLDDPTPDAVIERFLSENSKETVKKVVLQIDELLSQSLAEDELRRMLFEEFICYYQPSGSSASSWLRHVRASLAGRPSR